MILFCAIDILNGRAVRLLYGDYNKVTDYGDPVDMAKRWESAGAKYLHIVDLDGAKEGRGVNSEVVKKIVEAVKIPVQLGGGIRTLIDIDSRLNETGVARVILGTACCENPKLIAKAIEKHGAEKIAAGIDAKDGFVRTAGWLQKSNLSAISLANELKAYGLKYTIYTDISRDGALTGVNVEQTKELVDKTGLQVVASGGVSSLADIKALKQQNFYGCILGRAIYENKFTVAEALGISLERRLLNERKKSSY